MRMKDGGSRRIFPGLISCAVVAGVLAGLGLTGCAGPEPPGIPITTESDTAKQLFDEGRYLEDVGRILEAREKYRAATAEDPGFSRAYYGQSNVALSYKEFQDALDRAQESLEGKSDGERLLVEMNRTFLTNDTETGLALGKDLVAAYPEAPRAWIALAGMQGARNENPAARDSYAKALALDPGSTAALFAVTGNYLFGEPKDFEKADEHAHKLIELFPGEAKAYEMLGDVQRALNDLPAALEAYNKATELDSTLAQAQLKKGHVDSFLGNIDEARAAYDAAIDGAKPENRAFYANYRAFTHIHAGDVPGALEELNGISDAVETMGTPTEQVNGIKVFTLTNLATAALHAGLLEEAGAAIEKRNELQRAIGESVGTEDSVRLQEANCLVWEGLRAAYSGDHDLAVEKANEYAALVETDENPRKMEPHHWVMGMVQLRQGDAAKAMEHLRQADYENSMFIRYHLALAEEGAGEAESARKRFAEVAGWNFNSVGFALLRKEAAAKTEG